MKLKLRWLAFAVFITALASTVTFSRYTATVAGTDTATVANITLDGKFPEETAQNLYLVGLAPGETKTYKFEVRNYREDGGGLVRVSDVAQSYSIRLEFTGNLPVSYKLTAKTTEPAGSSSPSSSLGTLAKPWNWSEEDASKYEVTTQSDGTLPHSAAVKHVYILEVIWLREEDAPRYSYEVDAVTLHVKTEQMVK